MTFIRTGGASLSGVAVQEASQVEPVVEQLSENLAVHAAGAVIPKIGLGTWQLRGVQCAEIVAAALATGYTHVDTAQGYANEEFVGEGLMASGVPRDRIFITTKVRPDRLADGDLQRSVDESLSKLRTSEIDLLLLHWPNPNIPARGNNPCAELGQTRRAGPPHRSFQLHQQYA